VAGSPRESRKDCGFAVGIEVRYRHWARRRDGVELGCGAVAYEFGWVACWRRG
jgi:hypothetical protein